jgi:hypothetical protein
VLSTTKSTRDILGGGGGRTREERLNLSLFFVVLFQPGILTLHPVLEMHDR